MKTALGIQRVHIELLYPFERCEREQGVGQIRIQLDFFIVERHLLPAAGVRQNDLEGRPVREAALVQYQDRPLLNRSA